MTGSGPLPEQGSSVFSDVVCALGEGPTYDPATDTLFWFDILGRKMLSKKGLDGDTNVHDLPERASGLAVVDGDRHLLIAESGLYLRDARTGALSLVRRAPAGSVTRRSNDCRVHPCGALWFSMMGLNAEPGEAAIYRYCRGELKLLVDGLTIPNAICFSPDGTAAYFADSPTRRIWRVACDPATGAPAGNPAVFAEIGEGEPDGAVVDADGVLWNARWGAGAVDAHGPDGKLLRTLCVPASQSSCPAFVGPAADGMVVTSAATGLGAAALAAEPDAGKTFLLAAAMRGRHEPRVQP